MSARLLLGVNVRPGDGENKRAAIHANGVILCRASECRPDESMQPFAPTGKEETELQISADLQGAFAQLRDRPQINLTSLK